MLLLLNDMSTAVVAVVLVVVYAIGLGSTPPPMVKSDGVMSIMLSSWSFSSTHAVGDGKRGSSLLVAPVLFALRRLPVLRGVNVSFGSGVLDE